MGRMERGFFYSWVRWDMSRTWPDADSLLSLASLAFADWGLTQRPQRGSVSMIWGASRCGCGELAMASACFASAGERSAEAQFLRYRIANQYE